MTEAVDQTLSSTGRPSERFRAPFLLLTVLVISTAGLVYELLAAALASSRLGDSVTQFSMTIGVYLFSMGVGAYLSRYFVTHLTERFIAVEITLALVGGLEAPLLWVAGGDALVFRVVLYAVLVVVGTLVGLEIPLLIRILKEGIALKDLVARVLSVDYVGALLGSVLFALVLLPGIGMIRTSLLFGLGGVVLAGSATWLLGTSLRKRATWFLRVESFAVAAVLVAAFLYSSEIERWGEQDYYGGRIVFSQQTRYQRIVVTEARGSFQLHLNGHLQFSSTDEYRYHEALVHPAFSLTGRHADVLVLGGGDGLAVREILRYEGVQRVTLVDLDPEMTAAARRVSFFRSLNQNAFDDHRVRIVNDDAMVWLDEHPSAQFDVVLVDLPDPNNYSVGRLYTERFYSLTARALRDDGTLAIQATSPLFARQSYWCIERTVAAAGLYTQPYHALVPSFGEWGFVLARHRPFDPPRSLAVPGLRFLNAEALQSMFVFSIDIARIPAEPNRLNDQQLVRHYEREWSAYE